MEIRFFDEQDKDINASSFDNYVDLRFKDEKDSSNNIKRRLKRINGEKDISATLIDNNEIQVAFIGSSNTWTGLKTIFCNGLLVNANTNKKERNKYASMLIDAVITRAKQNGFENLLIESEDQNKDINALFSSFNAVHSRTLINYIIPTKVLFENTEKARKNLSKTEFKIKPGDVNNLTPYLGFMDTRQGWLSSNAAIGEEHGDELIGVKTQFDNVSSICVFNKESGVISRLATMPLARRSGFASALLNYASERIKAENTIVVDINKKNEDVRFYLTNLGFTEYLIKDETSYSLCD